MAYSDCSGAPAIILGLRRTIRNLHIWRKNNIVDSCMLINNVGNEVPFFIL